MGEFHDLITKTHRASIIQEIVHLIDNEVSKKSGLSGFAVKAGFKAVKAVKPGLIPEAIDHLLDEFSAQIEPFLARWKTSRSSLSTFLEENAHQVAEALLNVTDERAKQAHNRAIQKTYETLRPQGEKHVSAALPALGQMLEKFLK